MDDVFFFSLSATFFHIILLFLRFCFLSLDSLIFLCAPSTNLIYRHFVDSEMYSSKWISMVWNHLMWKYMHARTHTHTPNQYRWMNAIININWKWKAANHLVRTSARMIGNAQNETTKVGNLCGKMARNEMNRDRKWARKKTSCNGREW